MAIPVTLAAVTVGGASTTIVEDFPKCNEGSDRACTEMAVSIMLVISLSPVLLKEVEIIKPEALFYISEGTVSPALQSVVEKIQTQSAEQGIEISFDEVIDAISTL